jgi:hypothetical protein
MAGDASGVTLVNVSPLTETVAVTPSGVLTAVGLFLEVRLTLMGAAALAIGLAATATTVRRVGVGVLKCRLAVVALVVELL